MRVVKRPPRPGMGEGEGPTNGHFLFLFFCLFIYFWLCWVFVAARGLSQLRRAGATLRCDARASHCGGFSCCGARALGAQASVVVVRGLSSCGTQA